MRRNDLIKPNTLALCAWVAMATSGRAEAQHAGSDFRGFPAPGYHAVGVRDDGGVSTGTWLGGDGGFMTALPNGTIFAAFSDSSIGPGQYTPTPCDLNNHASPCLTAGAIRVAPNRDSMGNTVAIVSFSGARSQVKYYFRGDPGPGGLGRSTNCDTLSPSGPAGARAFFPVPNPPVGSPFHQGYSHDNCARNARIWPRKAIVINDRLYVFGNFVTGGGQLENSILIRVHNPNDPPSSWAFDYLYLGCFDRTKKHGFPLWATGNAAPCFFGNEAFVAGDPAEPGVSYLYTYGTYSKGGELFDFCKGNGFTIFPMRIPIAALERAQPFQDIATIAQYAPADTSKGRWLPGLHDAANAAATQGRSMVVVGDETNFASLAYSIRPNLSTGLWQAVYNRESRMVNRKNFGEPGYLKQICYPTASPGTDPGSYSAFIATSRNPYGPFENETRLFDYPGLSRPATGADGRPVLVNANLAFKSYATKEVPFFAPDDSSVALVTSTAGPTATEASWLTDPRMYTPLIYLVPNPLKGAAAHPSAGADLSGASEVFDATDSRGGDVVATIPAGGGSKRKPAPKIIRSVPSRPGP